MPDFADFSDNLLVPPNYFASDVLFFELPLVPKDEAIKQESFPVLLSPSCPVGTFVSDSSMVLGYDNSSVIALS